MRDEVCVMAEDPCSLYQRDKCGLYPTCEKSHPGGASCASTVCDENEYCKTENGMPKCVKKSTGIGYESAGVSVVNGYRTSTNDKLDKTSNSASNANPYANANAPPPEPADPAEGHHVNSGKTWGVPAYPSNSSGISGYPPSVGKSVPNSGYPPYPSTNQENRQQNLGYPPYPTQNRMPVPGQPAYPAQSGQYPAYPGYPTQPGYPQQYPGYQNYPYGNNRNQNRMLHNNAYSAYPTRRPGKIRPTPPTPPPRSTSNGFGGRVSGNSGSRNSIGNGSIFSRLFGNDRIYGSHGVTTPRSRIQAGAGGYHTSHTSVDEHGNRVWRFSG
ncbi:hypothetical protein WN48_06954 [Eufriesea mexicana]|uniref:Uncharacterized protein n=1 Tax=Eufriesea mexicana TaxID=516756 RepID=A0A310SWQ9_9HYME|nr:hypothetical protein WN48_06954 [Eufriesea mexicana]